MKFVVVIMLIVFPVTALAEPLSMTIKKGQRAPYDGVILNKEAQAEILAKEKFERAAAKAKREYEIDKLKEKHKFDLSMRKTEKEYIEKKHESIVKLKDKEIDRLNESLKENTGTSKHWWLAAGTISGVIISIVAFVAAASAAK